MKKEDIKVGDVVIALTGDSGKLRNKMGVVVCIEGDSFGIDFSISGIDTLHNMGGILTANTGWWLHIEDITKVDKNVSTEVTKEISPQGREYDTGKYKKWVEETKIGGKTKIKKEYNPIFPISRQELDGYMSFGGSSGRAVNGTIVDTNKGIISSDRTFGVELECFVADISDIDKKNFYFINKEFGITGDGSIRGGDGREIQTCPLSGRAGEEALINTCDVLKKLGFGTNSSCGSHVHIGIPESQSKENEEQVAERLTKLFIFYSKVDSIIRLLLPESRIRDDYYCRAMNKCLSFDKDQFKEDKNFFRYFYQAKSKETLEINKKDKSYRQRYCGINFNSIGYRGTLEVRYHHGTLDAKELLYWVALHAGIVDMIMSDTMTAEEIISLDIAKGAEKEQVKKLLDLVDSFITKDVRKNILKRYTKYLTQDVPVFEEDECDNDEDDYFI